MPSRVFVAGDTGGGKTHYLRTVWVPAVLTPLLILDVTGEWEATADAVVPDARSAVRALLAGHRTVVLSPYDFDAEADTLAPLLARPHPTAPSLPRALGGLAFLCDEADRILPNGRAAPAWVYVLRRGRHESLTLLLASQRATAVAREVTALSDHYASAAQFEPRDVAYWGTIVRPAWAAALEHLPFQGIVTWDRQARTGELLEPDGQGDYVVTADYQSPPDVWTPV